MENPTHEELQSRIQTDIDHYGEQLPDIVIAAWCGYIGALLEWGLIPPDIHHRLRRLLPAIENDPMIDIFQGREPD